MRASSRSDRTTICLGVLLMVAIAAMSAMREHTGSAVGLDRTVGPVKTVCVGRFLIDLPATAEVSLRHAFVEGFDISSRHESHADFIARVAAREDQLGRTLNKLGRKNLEAVDDVHANGFSGKIFVHGRLRTSGVEDGRRVYTEIVSIDAYLHKDGMSLNLIAAGYDPGRASNITRVVGQMVVRAEGEIPGEAGFCIDGALVRDPAAAGQTESVSMFAGLPGHPDLNIALSTIAGAQPGPGLLARNAAAASREPFYVRAAFSTLREGARTLNGLSGEELILKVREPNLTTGYSFDFEMRGQGQDVYRPLLTLELESGTNTRTGGKPVQSSLSEAELIALWDVISSSIRLRPVRGLNVPR